AEKIEAARDEGDLKENSGYHAARDEQGKQEARIRQLEVLLRNAKVGSSDSDGKTVAPGSVVNATVAGNSMRFLLGNREIAGDSISYEAPNGKTIEVKVESVEAFTG